MVCALDASAKLNVKLVGKEGVRVFFWESCHKEAASDFSRAPNISPERQ